MLRTTMTLLIALAPLGAAQAQQDDGKTMDVMRNGDQAAMQGPDTLFTGDARIDWIFRRDDPARVTGASVTFAPGARTAWHSHPLGQTLVVTSGVGWTQIEDGPRVEIRAGDVVWCPPERKHWHGATAENGMSHIAIQEALEGSNVTWMEKVTDEQYLAGDSAD